MYSSSSRVPYKNAVFTSSASISQSSSAAVAKRSLTVSNCATGENVSAKSNPGTCENPLATRCARLRPSLLTKYTHLHLMVFLSLGQSTNSQTSWSSRALTSPFMASCHNLYDSGSVISIYLHLCRSSHPHLWLILEVPLLP